MLSVVAFFIGVIVGAGALFAILIDLGLFTNLLRVA